MKTVLHHCRLISALSGGCETENGTVIVENGKITKVLALAGEEPPVKCKEEKEMSAEHLCGADKVIDCGGKTLLPGLIDLHVHICTVGCGMGTEYVDDFDTLQKACRSAQSFLSHGYTTVRDMGSTDGVACAVRDMVNGGILTGPRIIAGGRMLVPAGLIQTEHHNAYRLVSGVEEIRRTVREEIGESRADIVKIYASGSAYNPGGEPKLPILTREEIGAAVEMAAFRDRRTAAHCHSAAAIHSCLLEGVYTIEHGSYITEEDIEILQAEESYLVPTMSPYLYEPGSNKDPELDAFFVKARGQMLQSIAPHMQKAYEAGLKLGFGSDTIDGDFGNFVGAEFKIRKEQCGMANLDILLQATKISAMIAGLAGVCGEIREGFAADLILVDGAPDQDISAMYQKPVLVMKGGRIWE